MSFGKNKSSQKTREPYGKVTEVGQVPVALQEIEELSKIAFKPVDRERLQTEMVRIYTMVQSIIAVTCANPGCLSQMAENAEVKN